jgi:peroxiredoxin/outer membrane lipoprotein-sorting protein
MKHQNKRYVFIVIFVLAMETWALYAMSRSYAHWRPAMIVKDEARAHALYDAMIDTLQKAQSLSYSVALCSAPDGRLSQYKIDLKKPHTSRVSISNGMTGKTTTLIADGQWLWVYWSGRRMYWKSDIVDGFEKTNANVFIKQPAAGGPDSMAGEIAELGPAWFDLIWDPSLFHGRIDPYAPYIDGIRSRGTDRIRDEVCDVIEISYMNALRTRYVWISPQDHLPRKTKEIVRCAENHLTVSRWSEVKLNTSIPPSMFTWSPPANHAQWHPPEPEASLLKPGQPAPDFSLSSLDKQGLSLTAYRGKVVWLYLWRVGSPACHEAMPRMQSFYETYKGKGLVVLGLNVTDGQHIAKDFLQNKGISFPVLLDASETARDFVKEHYGRQVGNAPLSYMIDKQGNIIDAWYGCETKFSRALKALNQFL